MYTDQYMSAVHYGLTGSLKKEAFVGALTRGAAKIIKAPFSVGAGAAKKAIKYPFGGFKNPIAKAVDKKIGLRGLAGGTLLSGAFAAPGMYSQGSKYGKGVAASYAKPVRANLLSPSQNKSPMGNIF